MAKGKSGTIVSAALLAVWLPHLLRLSQSEGDEMPPNAGQQVRGDRAECGDDQGRVQERAQRLRHEQVHRVEPCVGQHGG
jgi:hypothetical protein